MSKLKLNFTEFSIDQPGFLKILPTEAMASPTERNVCVCCLDTNGPFVELGTCAHSDFVENICDAADIQMMEVCRLCHGMLLKIDMFKKQVEESLRRLSIRAENLDKSQLQPNRQINNLQCSTEQPSIISLNSIEIDIKAEPDDLATEYSENTEIAPETLIFPAKRLKKEKLKTKAKSAGINTLESVNTKSSIQLRVGPSIKVEFDVDEVDSDVETSVPLSEVKKEITAKRSENKTILNNYAMRNPTDDLSEQQMFLLSYTKSSHREQKYKGKIREVLLTLEQVMADREAELSKLTMMSFICLDCVKGFDFESKFEEHMKKVHNCAGEFQCEICKIRTKQIRRHYIRHYIRYECQKCNKRYKTLNYAFTHYLSHGDGGEADAKSIVWSCKDCNETFINYSKYANHQSKHNGPVPCEVCNKTFVNKRGLRHHNNLMHHNSAARLYKCEPCDKTFKEKSKWSQHEKVKHSGKRNDNDNTVHCQTCDIVFKSKRIYIMHLKNSFKHNGVDRKRFVCDYCGMKYVRKLDLIGHINWKHLKSTAHYCKLCDKTFQSDKYLRRHIAFVHEKKRPPKDKICDYCGKGFPSHAELRNHLTVHTGERPHRCDVCEATFGHPAALYTHRKLKHHIMPKKNTES